MKTNTDPRRAADALRQAIAARPDDFDHPGYEQLEALVDGRLTGADLEAVESHVEMCGICLQDVTDLSSVRDAIRVPVSAPARTGTSIRWRLIKIAAAVIAVVGLAMFARQRRTNDAIPTVAGGLQPPGTVAAPPANPSTSFDPLTADERALVDRVLASGRLEMPESVRALTAPVGTLLGAPEGLTSLKPLSPLGTAVVTTMPTFTWRPMPGAIGYTVAVYDEQFREVGRSPRLTNTSWTPTRALPRGMTLAWQITAHFENRDVLAPEPPQPEARFMVVDDAAASTIAAEKSRLADQPLALGVLLARAGAFDDAAREFERAARQPETSERAKTLLANLKR